MATQPAAPAPKNVESVIRQHVRDFVRFFNQKDVEALAGLYAEDAVFCPPNQEAVRGRSAIRQFADEFLKAGGSDLKAEPERIEASGDLAVEFGRYTMQTPDPKGRKREDRGKYVAAWRRQRDDTYRCVFDIFNSDLPPTT